MNGALSHTGPRLRDDRLDILLVEDDKFDCFVTQHYLRKGRLNFKLKIVHNGREALSYLFKNNEHQNARRPHLILIDVGLPDMDGRDVLAAIQNEPGLAKIPTIVLTGRKLEDDPVSHFHLFEHAYQNKWQSMDEFVSLVKAIVDFRSACQHSEQT